MFRMFSFAFFAIFLVGALSRAASASVQTFTDFTAWGDAIGAFTTITFADIPPGIVTDQYAEQGLLFTDGNDFTFPGPIVFPIDGHGLDGGPDSMISMLFDTPQHGLAVHFPGSVEIQLFQGMTAVSDSLLFAGPSEYSDFGGLISTVAFDRAVIKDSLGVVSIDNLYFGVPAPGALSLLALAAMIGRRRRSAEGRGLYTAK